MRSDHKTHPLPPPQLATGSAIEVESSVIEEENNILDEFNLEDIDFDFVQNILDKNEYPTNNVEEVPSKPDISVVPLRSVATFAPPSTFSESSEHSAPPPMSNNYPYGPPPPPPH